MFKKNTFKKIEKNIRVINCFILNLPLSVAARNHRGPALISDIILGQD
jgi:hypothetical protein